MISFIVKNSGACARVMIIVGSAQVTVSHVRVDLSCRNIAVTEQGLDRARVGAVLQQMSSKTMAQSMG